MNSLLTRLYIKAINAVYAFKKDQRGVTAIEYAILAAAVVALIAIVASSMRDGVNNAVGGLNGAIADAVNGVQ